MIRHTYSSSEQTQPSDALHTLLTKPQQRQINSDKCFVSSGYDATTHFETTIDDVLDLYRRITGESPDLDARNPRVAEQQQQE